MKMNRTEKLALGASIGMALGSFAVMLSSRFTYDLTWDTFARNLPVILAGEVAGLLCVLVCVALGRYWVKHERFGILETRLALLLDGWRQQIALKNAGQIAPALQLFLYCVLRRNQEMLQIPVGADVACLAPNGWRVTYRNRSAYYVFEIITDSPPEQDMSVLYKLLNQFIISELNNYGIVGLPSSYHTPHGFFPAVYLDRLTYDEVCHRLIFEVLFVGSESSFHALEHALQRDRTQSKKQPEPEVFDNEI